MRTDYSKITSKIVDKKARKTVTTSQKELRKKYRGLFGFLPERLECILCGREFKKKDLSVRVIVDSDETIECMCLCQDCTVEQLKIFYGHLKCSRAQTLPRNEEQDKLVEAFRLVVDWSSLKLNSNQDAKTYIAHRRGNI